MKYIFNFLGLISIFLCLIFFPLSNITEALQNKDIVSVIIWGVIISSSVYFIIERWQNKIMFDSNIQYILQNEDSIENKYKSLASLLKKYLNL